jgi:hypothetical protein
VWNKLEPSGGVSPPARWRHTSTCISKTQILVFGGFHNSTTRLNDVWIFDLPSRQWVQPVQAGGDAEAARRRAQRSRAVARSSTVRGGGSGGLGPDGSAVVPEREMLRDLGVAVDEPATIIADSNPDAPAPRGAHSAVLIGDHVWVFGGYGGAGYQRRDFNDVHRLHVPTMTWSRIEVVPTAAGLPEPRSGHIGQACRTSMIIQGGWNSSQAFSDCWSFDTERLTWTCIKVCVAYIRAAPPPLTHIHLNPPAGSKRGEQPVESRCSVCARGAPLAVVHLWRLYCARRYRGQP